MVAAGMFALAVPRHTSAVLHPFHEKCTSRGRGAAARRQDVAANLWPVAFPGHTSFTAACSSFFMNNAQVEGGALEPNVKMVAAGMWALAASGHTGHALFTLLRSRLARVPTSRMDREQLRTIGQVWQRIDASRPVPLKM